MPIIKSTLTIGNRDRRGRPKVSFKSIPSISSLPEDPAKYVIVIEVARSLSLKDLEKAYELIQKGYRFDIYVKKGLPEVYSTKFQNNFNLKTK